jgi:hypothetical protein
MLSEAGVGSVEQHPKRSRVSRGSDDMPTSPQLVRRPTRRPTRRRALLAAVPALALVLATPGTLLAKWTVVVEFEPTTATAGEPAQLAAVIDLVGHEVAGHKMPSLADIEDVRFRLARSGDAEPIVVPAVHEGPPNGRYVASVTLTQPGTWRVALLFRLDGELMSHDAFPDQDSYTLTVEPPTHDASGPRLPDTALFATNKVYLGTCRGMDGSSSQSQ